jgi:hypothetical protein
MGGMRQGGRSVQIIPQIWFVKPLPPDQLDPAGKVIIRIKVAGGGLKLGDQDRRDDPEYEQEEISAEFHCGIVGVEN